MSWCFTSLNWANPGVINIKKCIIEIMSDLKMINILFALKLAEMIYTDQRVALALQLLQLNYAGKGCPDMTPGQSICKKPQKKMKPIGLAVRTQHCYLLS